MKTVVITGSARGFGYAMLELFKKTNPKFVWLSNGRAAIRFMTSGFNKRDFFSK